MEYIQNEFVDVVRMKNGRRIAGVIKGKVVGTAKNGRIKVSTSDGIRCYKRENVKLRVATNKK